MRETFRHFANRTSDAAGSPWMFLAALLVIVLWGVTGPLFGFSDTWQLVINTGTTIVTFLMVFLVQNTQNRDAKAIHLKLDELLVASRNARTGLVNLEKLPDKDLEDLGKQFDELQDADAIKDEVREAVHGEVHEEFEKHVPRVTRRKRAAKG
jgi:low affinity Fe/Cu permease